MEILSVALKNFKSHHDRYFEFQPGTNAIYGENGAGKTSILEAIAWTLFDYSDYKKEDLIRKGAKSAQVTVVLISSLDGRTYQIRRCTSKGYEIYDPQLKQKLDYTKVDDVTTWLREHLGVEKGTDLKKLFAETIGIPQGTFTTDFLRSATDRKKVFDPILKVEEYKQAFSLSKDLENYAQQQVSALEGDLTQYAVQLQDWEALKQADQELRSQILQEESTLTELEAKLSEFQRQKDQLTAVANQIQTLTNDLHQLEGKIKGKEQANQYLQQALSQAVKAAETCAEVQESFEIYRAAESEIQQLNLQLAEKQNYLKQREVAERSLHQRQMELAQLKVQLESVKNYQLELDKLKPLVEQQKALEAQQKGLEKQIQQLSHQQVEQKSLEKQRAKVQGQLTAIALEISRLQQLEAIVDRIPEWERDRNRYQQYLSRLEAAQQFAEDLQAIVANAEQKQGDYLTQSHEILTQLKEIGLQSNIQSLIHQGTALNQEIIQQLKQILADLSSQVSAEKLQQRLQAVQKQLNTAYQYRADFATLTTHVQEQQKLEQEVGKIQVDLQEMAASLSGLPALEAEQTRILQALQTLNNPGVRSQGLYQELQRKPKLQEKFDYLQTIRQEISQEIDRLDRELARYADLEAKIAARRQLQNSHEQGYLTYLKQEGEAQKVPSLEEQLQRAIAELAALATQQQELQFACDRLATAYHPDQFKALEAAYLEHKAHCDRLQGGLPLKRRELNRLATELNLRQTLAEKRDRTVTELNKRQQIQQFIRDARQIYNQASPRITKFYLQEITREADQLFRELLNRPNVALEWTEDYEILVQEDGHKRGFKSLSGGEQMCAALAVRLALLRTLANIDVAFFDEPTTNMDGPRRRQLADAIANIKTFRQLFVISHDDTFENLSHFVEVKRQP